MKSKKSINLRKKNSTSKGKVLTNLKSEKKNSKPNFEKENKEISEKRFKNNIHLINLAKSKDQDINLTVTLYYNNNSKKSFILNDYILSKTPKDIIKTITDIVLDEDAKYFVLN